jgi:hypothetical protein
VRINEELLEREVAASSHIATPTGKTAKKRTKETLTSRPN